MARRNGGRPASLPFTDPAVYDQYSKDFEQSPLSPDPKACIQRAKQAADILALDATVREKENKSPVAEVTLLKSSGLTKQLGPTKYGGRVQGWDVAYKVICEVAKADGSLGQLLG